jgi:hypothetical protein
MCIPKYHQGLAEGINCMINKARGDNIEKKSPMVNTPEVKSSEVRAMSDYAYIS